MSYDISPLTYFTQYDTLKVYPDIIISFFLMAE